MTDKTEAQPEALRLELHQECADFATSLRSAANVVQLQGQKAPPSFLKAADLFEQAASEIQQLKAQLSARQAAPTGLTEAVFQVLEGWNIPAPVRKILETAYYAPPPPEREPLSADDLREPKNGKAWRVEWWNESLRMMLPSQMRLDRVQAFKTGTLVLTLKKERKCPRNRSHQ